VLGNADGLALFESVVGVAAGATGALR